MANKGSLKKARAVTIDDIGAVLLETAEETMKDLRDPHNQLAQLLRLGLSTLLALQQDPDVRLETSRSRSLQGDMVVWRTVDRLKHNQS